MTEQTQPSDVVTTVAVIDIGSNSIRMAVAQVSADGRVEVLERTQRAVHLGRDTFVSGRLGAATMNAAISILNDFRRVLDTYQVERTRVVATSAVREASNSDAFLDRVYMSCGLDIELISTSEESRLTVSAVRQALAKTPGIDRHDALVVEVGGGSALLTVLHEGQIATSESYRLGSIRLQEALAIADQTPRRAADLIRHQIVGIVGSISSALPMAKVQTFIAVGGDARFAAQQVGTPLETESLHRIGREQFDALVDRCEGSTAEQLSKKHDLSHPEAETLVPALLVYQTLLHETAAREVIVPATSMRDGLLLDVARSVTGQEDRELLQGAAHSAETIGEKYRYDAAHAHHVADLALRFYDELRGEHGLTGRSRLLLRIAAMLHEVGGFVSNRAHHKHSYYLISNAEVFGLNRDELQIVALVARYHRRSCPKKSHLEYTALAREKRVAVSKLAALLRVADALDTGHGQLVRDVRCERRPGELVIYAPAAADLTLERRAVAKKADLFEDIYGRTVRLEEAPIPME